MSSLKHSSDEARDGSEENQFGAVRREGGNQVACVSQKVGAECGAREQGGRLGRRGL